MELPGPLQVALEDGIVEALDHQVSLEAGGVQDVEHVPPVGVAVAGGAGLGEVGGAEHAVLLHPVPMDGAVLAVEVVHPVDPLLQHGQGVDELHHLVSGLPLQADGLAGDGVEHHLPGLGVKADVAGGAVPGAVHGAVLDAQLHALVLGPAGQLPEDLFVPGDGLLHRLALQGPGEGGDQVGAEQVGLVDELLQSLALFLVLQGVAVVADGRHRHAGVPQQGLDFLGVALQALLAEHHVEVQAHALEPCLDKVGQQLLGGGSRHAGANADLFHTRFLLESIARP